MSFMRIRKELYRILLQPFLCFNGRIFRILAKSFSKVEGPGCLEYNMLLEYA